MGQAKINELMAALFPVGKRKNIITIDSPQYAAELHKLSILRPDIDIKVLEKEIFSIACKTLPTAHEWLVFCIKQAEKNKPLPWEPDGGGKKAIS